MTKCRKDGRLHAQISKSFSLLRTTNNTTVIRDIASGTTDALSVTVPARSHHSHLNMIINTLYYASYCLELFISGLISNINIWKSYTLWASHNFIFNLHSLLMQTATIPRQTLHILWWILIYPYSWHKVQHGKWSTSQTALWNIDLFNAVWKLSSGGICSFLSTKRVYKELPCFNISPSASSTQNQERRNDLTSVGTHSRHGFWLSAQKWRR